MIRATLALLVVICWLAVSALAFALAVVLAEGACARWLC